MRKTSSNAKLEWRQLPFILIGGLLIGAAFGEAIKAFAPAPATVAFKAKTRP